MLVIAHSPRSMVRSAGGLAAIALSLVAGSALADVTKDQCIDSNGQAQTLRRTGRFSAARDQLRICSDAACPRMVRDDCARRLDDLDRVQPTIVFEAKDAGGRDLAGVKVTVDGQPFAEKLGGAALPVDPGEHAFTFEAPGRPATTQTFVVHEADKSRREVVVIAEAPPAPVVATVAPVAPSPEVAPSNRGGGQRIAGFALGGAGIVGVGLGTFFGIQAISKNGDAHCNSQNVCGDGQARISAIHAGNASTAAFIAGGVLLAGGVTLVLLAPKSSSTAAASLQLAPWVDSHGGGTAFAGAW
jgi:hypothetical protein